MKNISFIIFWGACWGVLEATLGWFLHIVHFKGEVLLLYPFGLMCMMMAYKQTGTTSSIIKVAAVAALVKLTNLLIPPAAPFYHVTNPAIAILLEGLVTWAFCTYMYKRSSGIKLAIPSAVLLMFVSILMFRGLQLVMDAFVAYNPRVHMPVDSSLLLLWGWRAAVQGLMLVGVYYLVGNVSFNLNFSKWSNRLALPLLLVALLLIVLV